MSVQTLPALLRRAMRKVVSSLSVADRSFPLLLSERNVPIVQFVRAKNHPSQSVRKGLSTPSPRRENRSIRGPLSQPQAVNACQSHAQLAPKNFRCLPGYRFPVPSRHALDVRCSGMTTCALRCIGWSIVQSSKLACVLL